MGGGCWDGWGTATREQGKGWGMCGLQENKGWGGWDGVCYKATREGAGGMGGCHKEQGKGVGYKKTKNWVGGMGGGCYKKWVGWVGAGTREQGKGWEGNKIGEGTESSFPCNDIQWYPYHVFEGAQTIFIEGN